MIESENRVLTTLITDSNLQMQCKQYRRRGAPHFKSTYFNSVLPHFRSETDLLSFTRLVLVLVLILVGNLGDLFRKT